MALQLQNWKVFSVGLGLGCDYDFMDRLARIGKTASDLAWPREPAVIPLLMKRSCRTSSRRSSRIRKFDWSNSASRPVN